MTSRPQRYRFTCQYPLLVNNCSPFTDAPSTDPYSTSSGLYVHVPQLGNPPPGHGQEGRTYACQRLCHRTNLVDLKEEAVAGFLLHSLGNPLWIGHSQIITHHLDTSTASELLPGSPVILVKRVFDGHHCRGTQGAVLYLSQRHPERSCLKAVVLKCCSQVLPTSEHS